MEENQVPNPELNNAGNVGKNKKGSPIKGLLLSILIVFLICVIGLLVRMVIAGDGDYFKPIKDIFGIEDEKDDSDDKKASKASSGKTSSKSGARYALLSSDVEGKNVKHYRLTVDMKECFKSVMGTLGSVSNLDDDDDINYNDYSFDFDDDDYSFDFEEDEDDFAPSKSTSSMSSSLEGMMGTAMMLVGQMGDMIDGEMYFDIYFEGNEIVQVVFGYDYEKFAENMYDYILDEDEDSLEEQGIESFDDFLEYLNDQFETMLDEDELYDKLMESADEDIESTLSQFGIKKKDIKDAIDFNCDTGIFEVYINGTTKVKAILSMALESDDVKEKLEELEDEEDVEIDEDNIIESFLKIANQSDEYSELGMKFVKVK